MGKLLFCLLALANLPEIQGVDDENKILQNNLKNYSDHIQIKYDDFYSQAVKFHQKIELNIDDALKKFRRDKNDLLFKNRRDMQNILEQRQLSAIDAEPCMAESTKILLKLTNNGKPLFDVCEVRNVSRGLEYIIISKCKFDKYMNYVIESYDTKPSHTFVELYEGILDLIPKMLEECKQGSDLIRRTNKDFSKQFHDCVNLIVKNTQTQALSEFISCIDGLQDLNV